MEVQWVVDAKAGTGESPVCCPEEEVLYWVDVPGCLLHRFDPTSAGMSSAPIGCVAQRRSGGLLVALKTGLFGFAPAAGVLEPLADPPDRHPAARFHGGRCDHQGSAFGSAPCAIRPTRRPGPASSIASTPSTGCGRWSPVWRPGTHQPGWPDPVPQRQPRCGPDHLGVGSRPRRRRDRQSPVFATTRDVAGRPDGAAVDADGCYWVAANDGWQLIRYTPQGRIDRTIRLPVRRPTMLAFGGRGAGGAATGRDPGLSEPRFAG